MSDSHASHSTEHHDHPAVPYYAIFGTLVVFTGVTIGASFVNLGSKGLNVSLAILIAAFKASLVMLFFMHLKYEKRPIVAIALAPFVLVAVLITALVPDIAYGQFGKNTRFPDALIEGTHAAAGAHTEHKAEAEHKEAK